MSLIKPKRRHGPRLLWLFLVLIAVVVSFGFYVYLTVSGVNNSEELKSKHLDYLFYWDDQEGGAYYYLRTSSEGKTILATFPAYSVIENSKEVLDPSAGPATMDLLKSWLGTSGGFSYFVQLSNELVRELSNSLGIEASNPVQFIDALAKRGFKLFDYWKLPGVVKTIESEEPSSTITPKGLAALLKRLGTSSRMAYEVETITQYPLKIKVGVNGESLNRLYIKSESIESVKKALSN